MLSELHIRDLGVISEAKVCFEPGLNVVTGETGVGKTLLVTSLGFVTGARAQARLVAHGSEEASVEAVVTVPDGARALLEELGADPTASEILLARRLSADGRSRAWLEGRLVPLNVLAELSERLFEMHGQGAGFALARPEKQREAIDALAGNDVLLREFRSALGELRALTAQRDRLRAEAASREREVDLLSFQADEIERSNLRSEEEVELPVELSRLEHSERLREVAASVLDLAGPEGASGLLAQAHKLLEAAVSVDPSLGPLSSKLGDVAADAAETLWDVRGWAEGLDADPSRLNELRERKAFIATLKRKYAPTIAEIIAIGVTARERLTELAAAVSVEAELDAKIELAHARTDELAAKLTDKRRRASKKLTKLVSAELPSLALGSATFEAECAVAEQQTEHGGDQISFLFSASRNGPPHEIGKVASGGELSRAMIAVTLALAQAHAVPVLVFDEAEQGVGGEAALELARRLARLARSHQVLVVSHLPQIAAFADRHIVVRRTESGVSTSIVQDSERLAEISRMLAGLETSERAKAHAAELVELGGSGGRRSEA